LKTTKHAHALKKVTMSINFYDRRNTLFIYLVVDSKRPSFL